MEAKEYQKQQKLQLSGQFTIPAMYSFMDAGYSDRLTARKKDIESMAKKNAKMHKTGFYSLVFIITAGLFVIATVVELIAGMGFKYWLLTLAAALTLGVCLAAYFNTVRITKKKKEIATLFEEYYNDSISYKKNIFIKNLLTDESVRFENVIMGGGSLVFNYLKDGKFHVESFKYDNWPDDPDIEGPFVCLENNHLFGRGSVESAAASFTTSVIID